MKLNKLLLIFTFICVCKSEEECINLDEDGNCLQSCPSDTIAYNPGCENVTMSQRTCRQPNARSLGYLCDYARCDCLGQKYWDEAAKKCVEWDKCSDQSLVESEDLQETF